MAGPARKHEQTDEADGWADLTSKGRQSREALLQAGMLVFGRDGFNDARIADIASEAGMSHGSFYTYFESKEAIFREIINIVRIDMAPPTETRASSADPYDQVLLTNKQYVVGYRRNAALMATFEQVSTFNPEIREYRSAVRHGYVERNSRAIKRWQAEGLADPKIDAEYAAIALGAMVDRFVYIWLVLGEDLDETTAVETMTRLWIQGIGLKAPARQRASNKGTRTSERSAKGAGVTRTKRTSTRSPGSRKSSPSKRAEPSVTSAKTKGAMNEVAAR